MNNRITSLNSQTGVVLIVSLIMLLLLTLIGLTGAQVTSLEEKMAGNARDQNIAFQAAESTLLVAERFILTNSTDTATYTVAATNATDGLLDITDTEPADYFATSLWTGNSTVAIGYGNNFVNNLGTAIADPRYIIQKIAVIPANASEGPKTVFKITARAQGISPGTQIILQEIFERSS